MKIQEMHIGQKVRDKLTRFEFVVVALGADMDGSGAWVNCDFPGNEGDIWEFGPEELEAVS